MRGEYIDLRSAHMVTTYHLGNKIEFYFWINNGVWFVKIIRYEILRVDGRNFKSFLNPT